MPLLRQLRSRLTDAPAVHPIVERVPAEFQKPDENVIKLQSEIAF